MITAALRGPAFDDRHGHPPDGLDRQTDRDPMPNQRPKATPSDITSAASASFETCRDSRLRQLMQALVHHLHEFATDVSLTEVEWREMIGVLTATGHITDDKR